MSRRSEALRRKCFPVGSPPKAAVFLGNWESGGLPGSPSTVRLTIPRPLVSKSGGLLTWHRKVPVSEGWTLLSFRVATPRVGGLCSRLALFPLEPVGYRRPLVKYKIWW